MLPRPLDLPASMNTRKQITEQAVQSEPTGEFPASQRLHRALVCFGGCVLVLTILFHRAVVDLVRLAFSNDLYSHVLLIPFVSIYLIWTMKGHLAPWQHIRWSSSGVAIGTAVLATIPLALYWTMTRFVGWQIAQEDALFLLMTSFVAFVIASASLFFPPGLLRSVAFPVVLLFFVAPFPKFVENAIEVFFQHTSADAAAFLFQSAGIPFVRQALVFELPRITIEVGQECSGVRSSLVLFITSLVGGYLFLQSYWKRTVLTLAIIPLAILRNGFRIFVIGMLCVHVDPTMINSWVHHKGGPLFFLLSLVPFFLLLFFLRRSEQTMASSCAEERERR
jgi:exosortase C (VPDSG-CTERM-specific)